MVQMPISFDDTLTLSVFHEKKGGVGPTITNESELSDLIEKPQLPADPTTALTKITPLKGQAFLITTINKRFDQQPKKKKKEKKNSLSHSAGKFKL